MFKWLIIHQWKEKTRSVFWQRNLWVYFLYGFFLIYLAAVSLVVGLYIGKILKSVFPGTDPTVKFTGFLLYYFITDLFLRFLGQGLPVMSIVPYLHLPVRRVRIFDFLLFKTLFSAFNWIPLMVIVPFLFKAVMPAHTVGYALGLLFVLIIMILINNFAVMYLKQVLHRKIFFIIGLLVTGCIVIYLDYKGYISLSGWLGGFLNKTASSPVLSLIPLAVLLAVYSLSRELIKREAYPENMTRAHGKKIKTGDRLTFLERYGNAGDLLRLELNLIRRNKRPRTYAYLSLFFLAYGVVFYANSFFHENLNMMVFIGTFMSAIFLIQYGQLLVAWDSEHFDFILTKNIAVKEYYIAKYWLFIISEIAAYVLMLPFGLFNKNIIFINFALLLYNMGVSTFIVLYMSVYNTAPVDLDKSAFLNYQGVKAAQFLLFILVVALPVLIFMPFSSCGYGSAGIIFLGIMGIAGILSRSKLMEVVTKKFRNRKYKIAISYRNN